MMMKGRILHIFIMLWLVWYIWGPVDPVVDFWDSPRQTMSDMMRAAGGVVVLIGAGFAVAMFQSRNLRDRFRLISRTANGLLASTLQLVTASCLSIPPQPIHAPPVLLRI